MSSTIDGSDEQARDDLELDGNYEEQLPESANLDSIDASEGPDVEQDRVLSLEDESQSVTSSRTPSGIDLPPTELERSPRLPDSSGSRRAGGADDTESNPDDTPSINVCLHHPPSNI